MVRHGQRSEPLRSFLQSFGISKNEAHIHSLCKHPSCWRSLKLTDKWLDTFPNHLRTQIYEKWFSVNGFRFLDLPPELREVVLVFAIGPYIEPFANSRPVKKPPNPRITTPNMSLALVSKQVYSEVMPVVFASATIYIRYEFQLLGFFSFDRPLRWARFVQGLRSLEIDLDPRILMNLFGVAVSRLRDNRWQYSQRYGKPSDHFTSICLSSDPVRKLRINVPNVYSDPYPPPRTVCQKAYRTVVWSAAREFIRNVPRVEFTGYVDETEKQKWLEVLASDRREVKTTAVADLSSWKSRIWDEWYVNKKSSMNQKTS